MDKYKGDKTYYVIDLHKVDFTEGRKQAARMAKVSINRIAGRQAFVYKDKLYLDCPNIKAKSVFAYWVMKRGEIAWV